MLRKILIISLILGVKIVAIEIATVKKVLSNPSNLSQTESLTTEESDPKMDLIRGATILKLPSTPNEVKITETRLLSLEKAIELAKTNNRQLRTAKLQLQNSEAVLQEAIASRYPNLSLQANGTRQLSGTGELSTKTSRDQINQQIEAGQAIIPILASQLAQVQTQLEQPFDPSDFNQVQQRTGLIFQQQQLIQQLNQQQQTVTQGQSQLADLENFATTTINGNVNLGYALYSPQREPSIKIAREQLLFNQLEVKRIDKEVVLNVALAYYSLQEADQLVIIAQKDVNSRTALLEDLAKLLEAALITRLDFLNSQVELDNATQVLRNSQAQQTTAQRNLAQLLSLPPSVTPVATQTIALSGEWNLSLEETIILAYANRVELEQQLAQRRTREAEKKLARAGILPQLNIFATYDLINLATDDPNEFAVKGFADGYSFGANVNWTLFDGGIASARMRQAQANIAIADEQFVQSADNIRFEVEQAYLQLPANRANVDTAKTAVTRAQEAVRAAEIRLRAGINTQSEVLDAQNRLVQAENNLSQAIINYNRAFYSLQRAVGGFSPKKE